MKANYLPIWKTIPILLITLVLLPKLNCAVEIVEQFKWTYINFTWPDTINYQYHLQMKDYIPENNTPTKIQIHNNRMYISLRRLYPGTPVTLGWVSMKGETVNPLITPYPNWAIYMPNGNDCTNLQNVNAFEIDDHNIMWILDGIRTSNTPTNCPAKLVLYNMSSNKILQSYNFPSEPFSNYQLTDMAIDGNYAYISDSNNNNPGIIIYSKNMNTSWKIHDESMFSNLSATDFLVNQTKYKYYHPVGPIVVSPNSKGKKNRFIFYSPVSSYTIYKINVNVLQNEEDITGNLGTWREYVHVAGEKVDQSFDYGMNQNGDLYFCLLNKQSLAKWNTESSFRLATYVTTNPSIDWCTGFAFGGRYIYLMTGSLGRYLVAEDKPSNNPENDFTFRVLRISIDKKKNHGKRN